jgi:hypothetical protein
MNMQKGDYLAAILKSPKTVFTIKDIVLLWQESNPDSTKRRINYYVKKGSFFPIRRGIYAKDANYSKLELATRIFTPSYVSFETVLAKEGMVFQRYDPIFIASYTTREININDQVFSYKKIKDMALTNGVGVEHSGETSVATKERAFLDIIYVNNNYHFDNLRSLDWNRVFEILPIYENKRMVKTVNKIYKTSDA